MNAKPLAHSVQLSKRIVKIVFLYFDWFLNDMFQRIENRNVRINNSFLQNNPNFSEINYIS